MPRVITPAIERFEAKVDRSGGPDACHPWTAATFKTTGYGVFHPVKGETTTAHRWLFIHLHGDPGPEVYVDHECHNRALACPGGRDCPHRLCCNPAHLVGKGSDENVKASPRANHRKTHCPRKHKYTPENTKVRIGPSGEQRICRTCERERDRRRAPARRAARTATNNSRRN